MSMLQDWSVTFSAAAARVQAMETPRIALAPSLASISGRDESTYIYWVSHQGQLGICQWLSDP